MKSHIGCRPRPPASVTMVNSTGPTRCSALVFIEKYSDQLKILIFTLLAGWKSLHAGFAFDDAEAIVNNSDVNGEGPASSIWIHDFWGAPITDVNSHKSYRPLTTLIFRALFLISRTLRLEPPFVFHLVGLLAHFFNCVLIRDVIELNIQWLFTGLPVGVKCHSREEVSRPDDRNGSSTSNKLNEQLISSVEAHQSDSMKCIHQIALWTSLLFAVHPIHTENICASIGLADLLCTYLMLATFKNYIVKSSALLSPSAKSSARTNRSSQNSSLRDHASLLTITFIGTGIAMLLKETGITLIGLCFVTVDFFSFLNLFHFRLVIWNALVSKLVPRASSNPSSNTCNNKPVQSSNNSTQRKMTPFAVHHENNKPSSSSSPFANSWILLSKLVDTSLVLKFVIYSFVVLILAYVRYAAMGGTRPEFRPEDNPASFAESIWVRFINYNYIYALNVWLLIYPVWLCFDWSMGCVSLIQTVTDLRLIALATFWAFIFFSFYHSFCPITKSNKLQKIIIQLSITFVVVPFLPATNLAFRVGFVIAERILYLPSLGYCLFVASGCLQLKFFIFRRYKAHQVVSFVLSNAINFMFGFLLVIFAMRSYQRSLDWLSEERLFKSGLQVCPSNAKVHYNVAKNAADRGDKSLAIHEYRQAIKLNPRYEQAMNNLANLLKENGQYSEAESLLTRAIDINPKFAAAHMNLGIVKASLKKYEESELLYLKALSLRRRYPDCLFNLGNLYLDLKRFDDAHEVWRNATRFKPNLIPAWNNLIVMLDTRGYSKLALSYAEEGLASNPNEATLHFNYANVLGKRDRFSESEDHFLIAIKLSNSTVASHFSNLGVLYHRWHRLDAARSAYKKALEISPDLRSARENLALLDKKRSLQGMATQVHDQDRGLLRNDILE